MKRWIAVGLLLALAGTALVPQTFGASARVHQLWSGAASDTTAVGMADSTGVIGTAGYERMALWIKPSRPCRMAIQVRAHGSSDTAGASLADTTSAASWPWRTFNFNSTTAASDSITLRPATRPTSVQAGADEMIVEFPDMASSPAWGGPRGLYIQLVGVDGVPYMAPATSIRIRVLTGGGVVRTTAALVGMAWSN